MNDFDDYAQVSSKADIGTPISVERRNAEPKFSISSAGALGRNIYNDIVKNVTGLKPVSGRIYIEVNIGIEDKRWFGDDETRASKLIIEVNMKE